MPRQHLLVSACVLSLLGPLGSRPGAAQEQGPGAAGYELQQGWTRALEREATAAAEAT